MRIVASIEARMTSSRLPGKVMMTAGGRPMLAILIERLKQVREIDEIVLATTVNSNDEVLEGTARDCGASVFRGSEDDVLGRVCGAINQARADVVVEITADCPLTDPKMVSFCIREYQRTADANKYIANTTGSQLGAPAGLDVQVFSADALRAIEREVHDLAAREHVSLPFYSGPGVTRWKPRFLSFFSADVCNKVSVTLDYAEDYALIKAAYESLSPRDRFFGAERLVEFCLQNPAMTSACLRQRE